MTANNQKESKESNARGGKRPGAGRKVGAVTRRTREIADAAIASGLSPLEYMLTIMRRESEHEDPKIQVAREAMRFEAAKAAAPYIHPKLASIAHTGPDGGPVAFERIVREIVEPK